MTFDLFSPHFRENPYPYYSELRRRSPVHYFKKSGVWAVSRYQDVVNVLTRSDIFIPIQDGTPRTIINTVPPDHTRLRKALSKFFSARNFPARENRIAYHTERLIEEIIARGKCELIADLASPLPQLIIAEILGIAPEHCRHLKRWATNLIEKSRSSQKEPEDDANNNEEIIVYLTEFVENCKREPQNGLISELARDNGQENLSNEEILNLVAFLALAGHETTTHLIGNAVLALLRHPTELQMVRNSRNLIPAVVEETLRYDTPVQMAPRTAAQDVEISGVHVPRGSTIVTLFGSANRDERTFVHPDRFLLNRNPREHIAFGDGPHFCIGASLARMEARIALEAFLQLLEFQPTLPLDRVEYVDHRYIRGLKRLDLTFRRRP